MEDVASNNKPSLPASRATRLTGSNMEDVATYNKPGLQQAEPPALTATK
jgi:hypothetical protein